MINQILGGFLEKASIPVMALPTVKAWISLVPS